MSRNTFFLNSDCSEPIYSKWWTSSYAAHKGYAVYKRYAVYKEYAVNKHYAVYKGYAVYKRYAVYKPNALYKHCADDVVMLLVLCTNSVSSQFS